MFVTTFGDFHQTLIKTLVVNIIMIVMGFQLHIANIPITASVTCCASHSSIFTCENISPVTHLLTLAANNSTSKFDLCLRWKQRPGKKCRYVTVPLAHNYTALGANEPNPADCHILTTQGYLLYAGESVTWHGSRIQTGVLTQMWAFPNVHYCTKAHMHDPSRSNMIEIKNFFILHNIQKRI